MEHTIKDGTIREIGLDGIVAFYANKHWGIKETTGKVLCEPKYGYIDKFSPEGFALVSEDGRFCFIDRSFKRVFSNYDFVRPFKYGFAGVAKTLGEWTFIDKDGKELTTKTYDYLEEFGSYTHAVVIKNNKFGFINREGKEVFGGCIYDFAKVEDNARLRVKINGDSFFVSQY